MALRVESYHISLDVDFQGKKYAGKEIIKITGGDSRIELDCVNLDVVAVSENGKKVSFTNDRTSKILRVEGNQEESRELEIAFSASVSNTLKGFYLARNTNGVDMLTTQLESTGARSTFPSFDRPDLKAEFLLELIIDKNLDAVSNMPVESIEELPGERKKIRFGKTPRMSTYLLYFGIGKFSRTTEESEGVSYTVIVLEGNLSQLEFPIDIAKKCVKYFSDYFQINYMLPKLDLIAVPQFSAGAMENWGAMTFREILLLVTASTSFLQKRRIAAVIAHEIAHQWFGDLVTLRWWNDTWLNESFATFLMYGTIDRLYPKLFTTELFFNVRYEGALLGDSLLSSHPIVVEVSDPDSISEIFDEISYGKGASVLRMFESFLGEETFRNGVHNYLVAHSYENAESADLWNELGKASGKDVSGMMSDWVDRMGYPVVTVKMDRNRAHFTQERFTINGNKGDEIWPVPLFLRDASGPRVHLMEERTADIVVSESYHSGAGSEHGNGEQQPEEEKLVLNAGRLGFYRVHYDEPIALTIKRADAMSEEERWGTILDYFAFLISGRMDFESYLSIAESAIAWKQKMPIQLVADQLSQVLSITPESEKVRKFATYFLRKSLGIARERSAEDERFLELEGIISSRLAMIDREYALEVSAKFDKFEEVKPELRLGVAMGYAITSNSIDAMLRALGEMKTDEDRVKIISAMGWVSGKPAMDKVRQEIQNGKVKKQDMPSYYVQAAMNPANRDAFFEMFPEIVRNVQTVFSGGRTCSAMIESVFPVIGSSRESEARLLADRIRIPGVERGVAKALEYLTAYSGLREKVLKI